MEDTNVHIILNKKQDENYEKNKFIGMVTAFVVTAVMLIGCGSTGADEFHKIREFPVDRHERKKTCGCPEIFIC